MEYLTSEYWEDRIEKNRNRVCDWYGNEGTIKSDTIIGHFVNQLFYV